MKTEIPPTLRRLSRRIADEMDHLDKERFIDETSTSDGDLVSVVAVFRGEEALRMRAVFAPSPPETPAGNDVVCGDHWHGLSGEPVNGSTGCPWCHVADLQAQIAKMEGAPAPETPAPVGAVARDGKGVVANPGTPAASTLLCVSCGRLPPYNGCSALCPACNGTPTPAAREVLAAIYGGPSPASAPRETTAVDIDALITRYGEAVQQQALHAMTGDPALIRAVRDARNDLRAAFAAPPEAPASAPSPDPATAGCATCGEKGWPHYDRMPSGIWICAECHHAIRTHYSAPRDGARSSSGSGEREALEDARSTPPNGPFCEAPRPGGASFCARTPGHSGDHVSVRGDGVLLARWATPSPSSGERVRALEEALRGLVRATRAYSAVHRVDRCSCPTCDVTRAAIDRADRALSPQGDGGTEG